MLNIKKVRILDLTVLFMYDILQLQTKAVNKVTYLSEMNGVILEYKYRGQII